MSITNFNSQIIGRLGQDAIVRPIGEWNAISFSVAIQKKKKDEYVTSWINCTYWSKSDKVANYLKKGTLVSAVADWFETTEKDAKMYVNFNIREINPFLEKKEKSHNQNLSSQPTQNNEPNKPLFEDEEDDLPF